MGKTNPNFVKEKFEKFKIFLTEHQKKLENGLKEGYVVIDADDINGNHTVEQEEKTRNEEIINSDDNERGTFDTDDKKYGCVDLKPIETQNKIGYNKF